MTSNARANRRWLSHRVLVVVFAFCTHLDFAAASSLNRRLRTHPEAAALKTSAQADGEIETDAGTDSEPAQFIEWLRRPPAFQRAITYLAAEALAERGGHRRDVPHDYRLNDSSIEDLLMPYNESWAAWVDEMSGTMRGEPGVKNPKRPVEHYMCRIVGFLWIAAMLLFMVAMLLALIQICFWFLCGCWSNLHFVLFVVCWVSSMIMYAVAAFLSFTYLLLSLSVPGGPLERAFDGKKNDDPPCMVVILFSMIVACSMIYHWCITCCINCCAFTHQAYEGRQERFREEERRKAAEIEAQKELPKLVLTVRVEQWEGGNSALLTFHNISGNESARIVASMRKTVRELWSEIATAAAVEEWQICLVSPSQTNGKTITLHDALTHSATVSDLLEELGISNEAQTQEL